jgi:hypothetical protein
LLDAEPSVPCDNEVIERQSLGLSMRTIAAEFPTNSTQLEQTRPRPAVGAIEGARAAPTNRVTGVTPVIGLILRIYFG